jgi:methylmalonyl-CoA/ethylmalonyl-CoA epimerase
MKVDHVGVAVKSIDDALPFYKKALGLEPSVREQVTGQHVRVAFLQAGETAIELLEPISDEGAIAKFVRERGPGLHHVAFHVPGSLGDKMRGLTQDGLSPLEPAPRLGARGHHVCFLHPKLASGVLVELVGAK